MKVDLLVISKFFQTLNEVNVFLVLIRVAERKLDYLVLFLEKILDGAFYLPILVKIQLAFCFNSFPRLSPHTINWTIVF